MKLKISENKQQPLAPGAIARPGYFGKEAAEWPRFA
jgi:hypothetical protein